MAGATLRAFTLKRYWRALNARRSRGHRRSPGSARLRKALGPRPQFFDNLLGNTQLTRQVRLVTKSINPKAQAVWTLRRLHARLSEWAYEIYDSLEHQALGQSPREAFAAGLIHGHRQHRLIAYDEQFQLLTLPTTRKGTAKVITSRGVKINGLFYWSDQFRDPTVEKTQVPVRYDPYDLGLAWAFVARRWVRCVSEYHAVFHGRSKKS